MTKSGTISMMLTSLVAIACLFAVASPVGAGIDVTIYPNSSLPGASPEYTCVLNNSTGDIYVVNVTIPAEYSAVDTENCFCSVNLTLQNESTDEIISKSFAYSNESGFWVNVTNTSSCDGVYGPFVANCSEGDVTEMCMASTAALHLTMPTASVNGSLNISLGALGPIAPGDDMTLAFASGMIRNPATNGYYAWSVTADPGGYSDTGVVRVAAVEYDSADTNHDCVVSMLELMTQIGKWKSGEVEMPELMTSIGRWKSGVGYC